MSALVFKLNLPRGPEHYWKAACDFGPKGFTVSELFWATNARTRGVVSEWINKMVALGHIALIEKRDVKPRGQFVYAVTRPTTKAPVDPDIKHGRIARHLWTAMRNLPMFTVGELAAAASTDDVVISRKSASDYVRMLELAGALVVVREAKRKSLNSGVYRLKKSADTGPLAPREISAKVLIDRNTGKALGAAEARL
jgi:hypothetical protein